MYMYIFYQCMLTYEAVCYEKYVAKVQVDMLDWVKQEVIYSKYAMNTLMSNFIQGAIYTGAEVLEKSYI